MTSAAGTAPSNLARHPLSGLEAGLWAVALTSAPQRTEARFRVVPHPSSAPSLASDGPHTAAFFGVLHDARELASELGELEPPVESGADLIMRLYRRHGPSGFDQLRGAFVGFVWDGPRETLYAFRDQVGMFPLYYAETPEELVLSPTLDGLLAQDGVSASVDLDMVADELRADVTSRGSTWYADIKRVPFGQMLVRDSSSLRLVSSWSLPEPSEVWAAPVEVDEFERTLGRAVDRRLATGPAGIHLSGGLDSISVAALMHDADHYDPTEPPLALSLDFPTADTTEASVQTAVAARLGLPHLLVPLDEAMQGMSIVRSIALLNEESPFPMVNPWDRAYRYLGRLAHESGVRTILTGGGGDEWLTVTPRLASDLWRRGDVRGLARLYASYRRSYDVPRMRHLRLFVWTAGLRPLLRDAVFTQVDRRRPGALTAWRRKRLSTTMSDWLLPEPTLRRAAIERTVASLQAERRGSYYLHETQHQLQHPVMELDREADFYSARRTGVLIQQPYWDLDVVNLVHRTRPTDLNRGGRSKGLLRELVARKLPGMGLERQKKAHARRFYLARIHAEAPEVWRSLGGPRTLAELGLVDAAELELAAATAFAGEPSGVLDHIIRVIALESWVRNRV